jgi:hypothetical protein
MESNDDESDVHPIGWYKKQGIGRFKRFGCIIAGLLIGLFLLVMLLKSALPDGY